MLKEIKYLSKEWEKNILEAASDAIECAIASAYFDNCGVSILSRISNRIINSISNGASINIKILLSDNFAPTEEKRREILKKIEELPYVEARIYCNENLLHIKNYIFRTEREIRAIIGSANLTSRGFFCNLEQGVYTIHEVDDPKARELIEQFDTTHIPIFDTFV